MGINKVEEAIDAAQIYGNAFLGPNLWSKDELFPTDELRLSLDLLDSEDFLNDNGLEAVEEKIIEKINTSKSVDISTKKSNKRLEKESEKIINMSLDEMSISDQNSNFSFSAGISNKSESEYDSSNEKKTSKRVC